MELDGSRLCNCLQLCGVHVGFVTHKLPCSGLITVIRWLCFSQQAVINPTERSADTQSNQLLDIMNHSAAEDSDIPRVSPPQAEERIHIKLVFFQLQETRLIMMLMFHINSNGFIRRCWNLSIAAFTWTFS